MAYLALATDYDGTIAQDGVVDDNTLAALKQWRSTGRKLILISGRQLDDFLAIFQPIELFDLLVVENGAVLYDPITQTARYLSDSPPPHFVEQLRQAVEAAAAYTQESDEFGQAIHDRYGLVSQGRVIVATWQPHSAIAQTLIEQMQLPLQVILNKNAVMILPQGVDKAIGLATAAQQLGVELAQVVSVGDAENDLAFLTQSGFAAAVANALPEVKAAVDWVASASHGAGVVELIDKLLDQNALGRSEP